jgi:class 3 adenylate cyclase
MQDQNKELLKRISGLVKQNKRIIEKNALLSKEVENLKNENLELKVRLDLVPEDEEIKKTKTAKPSKFDRATVLYAGIHGSAKENNQSEDHHLADDLDQVLLDFDEILSKYGIIKTKSIGDTLICIGGVSKKNSTNPIEVVLAALEMQQILSNKLALNKSNPWDIRFGIHTGSIVAEISGRKQIHYNVKGDTVNIASRMEGWSDIGKVNISIMTYELIKEFFICEYYGKMPVRYKGNLQMFTVKGIRPELSENGEGLVPNKAFRTKFFLVQFTDLQETMLDRLERELPSHLYYHNVKHTVDVVTQVELIGWGEAISDEEILLLKTAALFHDAGHVIGYDEHEYHGTVLVREYLPKFNYTEEEIEKICELIMATKLPPMPKNRLEEIMCDSDLDYLGRSDMIPVSGNLFKELKKQNKIDSLNDWNKLQLKFISNHQYFTGTARNLREVNKQKQIERIKSLIV